MHVPDGFLDLPTSIGTAVVTAGAVGVALSRLRRDLDDRWPVRAGLTAAFVFAAQLVNFPVGAGTSGHLVGAALATALVGPAAALLVMTSVLVLQALVFADGGLTALGTNVVLLGVVGVLVSHAVSAAVAARLRDRQRAAIWGAAAAAFVSVPAAALVFCGLYAVGGAIPVPAGQLTATMVGVHLVIGLGEAVITALCVGSIVGLRPDLVALGAAAERRAEAPGALGRRLVGGIVAVTVVVAGGLSIVASAAPDGLEWSAEQLGFADAARDSAAALSPFADYAPAGLGWASAPAAGLFGVAIVLVVARLVSSAVKRRQPV